MTIVTVSDLYYKIVPDIVLLFFFPIILGLRLYGDTMMWYESILGGVLAFIFLYLIALYGKKRFNKDALGGGDIKLYLLIGLFLGYQTVFLSLIFASVIGLIMGLVIKKDEHNYIAFVPFIYAGSMLAYVFGDSIITAYETFLAGLM
jgi:leader peptidase (prepilin peptidase)/N-methyltransferase